MKTSSFTILTIYILLVLTGLLVIPLLPVQLVPNYSLPSININYSWKNASPKAIEQEVTSVFEGGLNTIKGLKHINSQSGRGKGSISLQFSKDTDMDIARFEVASIIRSIHPLLLHGVSYPFINIGGNSQNKSPALVYAIISSMQPDEIQEIATENIQPLLSEIKGVDKVSIYGAMPYRYHIRYDIDKMQSFNLSLNTIKSAINNTQIKNSVGIIYEGDSEIGVTFESKRKDTLALKNIPLSNIGSRIIYLKDIASVTYEPIPPNSHFRINGKNNITLVISANDNANQIQMAEAVKAALNEQKNVLPGDIALLLRKDTSKYIKDEVNKIVLRSILALAILLVFVFIISLNIRYLSVIFISLLANLSIAFFIYYLLGIELHLYSFAGITVSLGLLIDNSIVMVDHIRYKNNRRVFTAIFASTITTIIALNIIFFLDEKIKANLVDFVIVVMVNLIVSLFIALFFIPALMDKISINKPGIQKTRWKQKRIRIIRFTKIYQKVIVGLVRFKAIALIILALGFGLPFFLLPDKIENKEENFWPELYNKTFGSKVYNKNIRKVLDKGLGGTLRLFSQKVDYSRFFSNKERTNISIRAQMPQGASLEQMNEVFIQLESYLKQFKEIDRFETSIRSGSSASMNITFKKEHEFSSFPFLLKDLIVTKAISFSDADFQVYGQGDGFNNSIRERTGSYKIDLKGYNYETLLRYANILKEELVQNPRIQEISIMGKNQWYRDNIFEYVLDKDNKKLMLKGGHIKSIFGEVKENSGFEEKGGRILENEESLEYVLSSSKGTFNTWNLYNNILFSGSNAKKLVELSTITKENTPQSIHKYNQQYYLMLEYDFIGPGQLGSILLEEKLEEFNKSLPIGYSTERQGFRNWGRKEKKQQYGLIFLIVLIIYFTCSILLESLIQPLAVIFMIPVTFIGVFLTFYLFNLKFDQGGYASFVLLCGLTVNSALFIINDMNNLRKNCITRKSYAEQSIKIYLKAFNGKIIPVLLAILSTVLGLIPFIIAGQKETFWFPLAAGTIGGLLFSLLGVYFVLPLFFIRRKKIHA